MKSDTFSVLSAEALFNKLKIDTKFPQLRQLAGLDDIYFDRLYKPALYSFAEAAQLVPASEAHHHARPGGLLEHTIDLAHISMRLRKGYKLPVGATAEIVAKESSQWTYAVFIGALFHDIGKLISDFRILAQTSNGQEIVWTPLHGDIQKLGATHYRVEFLDSNYRYHSRLCASCFAILPPVARGWLAEHPELFYQLTSYLSGELYDGSIFGQIVTEADRASVAADLKQPKERFSSGRKRPLADHILDAIRIIIRERTVVRNRPGAMAWVKDGMTYMVCRPFVTLLQNYFSESNLSGLPREFTRVYDLLLEHGIVESNPNDETASIWSIRVSALSEEGHHSNDSDFDHKFAVLAFKTDRIFLPTRMPEDYEGEIRFLDQKLADTAGLPEGNLKDNVDEQTTEPNEQNTHDENNVNDSVSDVPVTSRAVENRQYEATHTDKEDQIDFAETEPTGDKPLTWDDDIPQALLEWIRSGIEDRKLPYNKPNSVIHIVEYQEEVHIALVTPAFFQKFCKTTGINADEFHKVQKRFWRKKWHTKSETGSVHALWTKGDNRSTRLNCNLIPASTVLSNKPPAINKYIAVKRPE